MNIINNDQSTTAARPTLTFGPAAHNDPQIALGVHVSPELVSLLETMYPDRMPEPDISDRDLLLRMGHLQVVRLLRQAMEAAHQADMPLR